MLAIMTFMKTHLLIDGSGFIFRAYFAYPPMTNPAGTPVNAVYGFCHLIRSTLKRWPDHTPAVVMFDTGKPTFRSDIYGEYKAHRPSAPEDLVPQFGLIHEACKAMGLQTNAVEGFEADDLLATYTHALLKEDPNNHVVVVTIDKDMMQLVQPRVRLFNPMKRAYLDRDDVIAHWGVPPEQVVEVMSLAGDASDGVPGIPGIGPKTAAGWIQEHGTLEKLLRIAHTMKPSSKQKALVEHAEKARMSRLLVQLHCEAPLKIAIDQLSAMQTDDSIWQAFCKHHGFESFSGYSRA